MLSPAYNPYDAIDAAIDERHRCADVLERLIDGAVVATGDYGPLAAVPLATIVEALCEIRTGAPR